MYVSVEILKLSIPAFAKGNVMHFKFKMRKIKKKKKKAMD